jgi:PAS domain-containing protein
MFSSFLEGFDNSLVHWEEVIAALIGISVFIFGLLKFLKGFYKSIKSANKSVTEFLDLIPDLKKVASEFKPNGGKSLKDILNRLDNSLNHTEQKIRLISSCLGVAYFETDNKGQYTFVSKKWIEITDFNYDQAVGDGWLGIVHKEMRKEAREEWLSCMEQKREFHFNTTLSNNENKDISIVAWPIKNIDGSIEKFFGILFS